MKHNRFIFAFFTLGLLICPSVRAADVPDSDGCLLAAKPSVRAADVPDSDGCLLAAKPEEQFDFLDWADYFAGKCAALKKAKSLNEFFSEVIPVLRGNRACLIACYKQEKEELEQLLNLRAGSIGGMPEDGEVEGLDDRVCAYRQAVLDYMAIVHAAAIKAKLSRSLWWGLFNDFMLQVYSDADDFDLANDIESDALELFIAGTGVDFAQSLELFTQCAELFNKFELCRVTAFTALIKNEAQAASVFTFLKDVFKRRILGGFTCAERDCSLNACIEALQGVARRWESVIDDNLVPFLSDKEALARVFLQS